MGLYLSGSDIMDSGNQLLCFHSNDSLICLNSPNGSCGYIKVGINTHLLNSEIRIFPNPVTNQLIIESNQDIFVEVFNYAGRRIISSNNKQIDLTSLQNGVFVVKIYDSKKTFVKAEKILKH